MQQIRLDAATRAGIAARQQFITQQQLIVRSLQLELEAFIAQGAGVDLHSAEWTLDAEHGLLTRDEAGEGAVQPQQHKLLEKECVTDGE